MDSYENSEDDIDEMETIPESSDEEEEDSSYNIQKEKERDTIENFVNQIFKETAQSSPETEVPKEQVQEIKKPKKSKRKPPFAFKKIPLFGKL